MMKIKALFTDVDGVLTDGAINIGVNGELFKTFNSKDGVAIKELLEGNIIVAFITGRKSNIVNIRAKELGVSLVYQNVKNKSDVFQKLKQKVSSMLNETINNESIVYVGDDILDNEVLKITKSFCPSDATEETKKVSKHVLKSCGGEGCIRETVDYLKKHNLL